MLWLSLQIGGKQLKLVTDGIRYAVDSYQAGIIEMQSLSLFPLPAVLFPGISIPLLIIEPRYLKLISASLKTGCRFGVVALSEGGDQSGAPKIVKTGVLASVTDWYQQEYNLLGVRQVSSGFQLL